MTSTPRNPLVGVFDDRQQAVTAIEELDRLGVRQDDMIIVEPSGGAAGSEQTSPSQVHSALVASGLTEEEAQPYVAAYHAGRTLVLVHSSEHQHDVAEVLRRYRADRTPSGVGGEETERLEIREENLIVEKSKRRVGEVRVRKDVEEIPSEATIDVRRERVEVERVPIDEVVSERRGPWREDDVLIVPVYEERPVVVTELVLREQIRLRHVATTEQEVVAGTIRRERPIVEAIDAEGNIRSHEPMDQDATGHQGATNDDAAGSVESPNSPPQH